MRSYLVRKETPEVQNVALVSAAKLAARAKLAKQVMILPLLPCLLLLCYHFLYVCY